MKQVLQNLETGVVRSEEVPAPAASAGHLLIQTRRSLVSSGTERMLVEFGRKNLLDKARSQPDKVRQVLDKARTDGVLSTLEAVRAKLDQPLSLGYSNVGTVVEVGAGVVGFARGDRVVSNGKHAELVLVPQNLCAHVPVTVSDDAAAFTVLAAIGLQGLRLAQPSLGETVAVIGLGLIGLCTLQLARAHGCRVLGLDIDPARLALAAELGADVIDLRSSADPVAEARDLSHGHGVDAVLLCASTESDDPVSLGARMCRKRGRIVLVGTSGLTLSRADFYEKELSFTVSCSYGPGRYDPEYEQGGHDYPLGFVRWTEQRNFEAVLDRMEAGSVVVDRLVSHRFAVERAEAAYDLLASNTPSLGILLEYPAADVGARSFVRRVALEHGARRTSPAAAQVGFIGTGNYAARSLIPAFKAAGAGLHTALSQLGVSALHQGRKFGFAHASTDLEALLADRAVDSVVIATRHVSHASLAVAALRAGKHVFVEKPLCLTLEQLAELEAELEGRPGQCLMVGFNRRFAPHVLELKRHLAGLAEPKALVMTVNAGAVPSDHWVVDPGVGGGRIVGEACHFIDLLRHLAGAPIVEHTVHALGARGGARAPAQDATLSLTFADGSLGTIHYLTNGHKSFPKERLEVFCAGRVLALDNFRSLRGHGAVDISRPRSLLPVKQDKGQLGCARAFVDAVRSGGPPPISRAELLEVSRVSILAQRAVSTHVFQGAT